MPLTWTVAGGVRLGVVCGRGQVCLDSLWRPHHLFVSGTIYQLRVLAESKPAPVCWFLGVHGGKGHLQILAQAQHRAWERCRVGERPLPAQMGLRRAFWLGTG